MLTSPTGLTSLLSDCFIDVFCSTFLNFNVIDLLISNVEWSTVLAICHHSGLCYPVFRQHLSCAHQPSLAAHPWAHLLQIGRFNISSHSWRWTGLFPVLLHSRRRHAVTTTTAFVRLSSLARTDHSSIHSRQSHIHSFRRRGMERPAGSRHSCAVTRGVQTAP